MEKEMAFFAFRWCLYITKEKEKRDFKIAKEKQN